VTLSVVVALSESGSLNEALTLAIPVIEVVIESVTTLVSAVVLLVPTIAPNE